MVISGKGSTGVSGRIHAPRQPLQVFRACAVEMRGLTRFVHDHLRVSVMSRLLVWLRVIHSSLLFILMILPGGTVSAHQPHDPVVSLSLSPRFAADQTLFIAVDEVPVSKGIRPFLKSTDAGLTWSVIPNFPNILIYGIAISPAFDADRTLFAATEVGLYRSIDGGLSWSGLETRPGATPTAIAISPGFDQDHRIFGITRDRRILVSTDRGDSWILVLETADSVCDDSRVQDGLITTDCAQGDLPHGDEFDDVPKDSIVFSPSYQDDNTVFSAIEGRGLFMSTDGGACWTLQSDSAWGGGEVASIAIAPDFASSRVVFVSVSGAGIFVSRSEIPTWSPSMRGIDSLEITDIAVSPSYVTDKTVFATSAEGDVYESTDGGRRWEVLDGPQRGLSTQTSTHYREIALSPNFGSDRTVFLATFEGLWSSQDAGASWRYSELLPISLTRSMAISPRYAQDRTLLASTYGGSILRTTDGGSTWEVMSNGLVTPFPDPIDITYDSQSEMVVWAGTMLGPQLLTGADDFWIYSPVGYTTHYVRALAISTDYAFDGTIAIGRDNTGPRRERMVYDRRVYDTKGLFISRNEGLDWMPTELNGIGINDVEFSPRFDDDRTIYAVSAQSGLFRSRDGGSTWSDNPAHPIDCCLTKVVISSGLPDDGTILVTRPLGDPQLRGIYMTIDAGASWKRVSGSESVTVMSVAVSPGFPSEGTLFIGTLEQGLLKSTDGGTTLSATGLAEPFVTAVTVSPTFEIDRTLYAAAFKGIFKSEDGGKSWLRCPERMRYEERHPSLTVSSGWSYRPSEGASALFTLVADRAGDFVNFDFFGQGVSLIGERCSECGTIDVSLNGAEPQRVALHSETHREQEVLLRFEGLASGAHKLRITVVVEEDAGMNRGGRRVALDAFDVER